MPVKITKLERMEIHAILKNMLTWSTALDSEVTTNLAEKKSLKRPREKGIA